MGKAPLEEAQRVCDEILAENRGKRFTLAWLQCFFCSRFGRSCIRSENGCNLVNKRYQQRYGTGRPGDTA